MPLRLRPDIATTDTDEGLVLLDERSGAYWQLNPTGALVLRALLGGEPPGRIAQDLATRYRIDTHRAHHDVTTLIEGLYAARLVASS